MPVIDSDKPGPCKKLPAVKEAEPDEWKQNLLPVFGGCWSASARAQEKGPWIPSSSLGLTRHAGSNLVFFLEGGLGVLSPCLQDAPHEYDDGNVMEAVQGGCFPCLVSFFSLCLARIVRSRRGNGSSSLPARRVCDPSIYVSVSLALAVPGLWRGRLLG